MPIQNAYLRYLLDGVRDEGTRPLYIYPFISGIKANVMLYCQCIQMLFFGSPFVIKLEMERNIKGCGGKGHAVMLSGTRSRVET